MFDNLPSNNANANSAPKSIYPPVDGASASRRIDNRPRQVSPIAKEVVEDMFSETEKTEKPPIFQPKSVIMPNAQFEGISTGQYDSYTGEAINTKNKVVVLVLMLVSLILVFVAGWYAYRMFFAGVTPSIVEEENNVTGNDQNNLIENNSVAEENNAFTDQTTQEENTNTNTIVEQSKDSDGDGLTDDEEYQLGTNLNEVDSDGDGLFDREEVKVYKTNAMVTDTDKDGYSDGIEVKGGYEPNGPGKLYKLDN